MKKREIALVVVLIAFGLLYQAIERGRVRFVREFSFYSDERKLTGSRFREFPEVEKQFTSVEKVVVENPAGEVVIGKSPDDQVRVQSILRVYYSNEGDVERLRKKTAVAAELQNGELRISGLFGASFPYHQVRILVRLSVPENIALSISNQEGNTVIRGTGKDVQVNQVNGSLVLENIPSALKLRLKNCNANIKSVTENAEIRAYQSDVFLEDLASLRIQGERGDFSITNVKGSAYVEHSYGRLEMDGVGEAEIHARHCRISAKNIRNGAIITNKYDQILLENVKGDVRLSTRLGKIDIRHIESRNVVIENSYADIVIADYSGESMDVLLKNGNLDLQVNHAADRINIQSRHAELTLRFGALLDPTFNIKTRHGRIDLQTPLEFDQYEENAENYVNRLGLKPEILINNTYGNVLIKSSE